MKVYAVCEVWEWEDWDWENEKLDKIFATKEKAVNYIANKINKYKDNDKEIIENNLDEIKAKLQENLNAYPSYYTGYEKELE